MCVCVCVCVYVCVNDGVRLLEVAISHQLTSTVTKIKGYSHSVMFAVHSKTSYNMNTEDTR